MIAQVDMTDNCGNTPPQYAAERGNAAAAKELLEVGAVITMRDITGRMVERGSQSVIDVLDGGEVRFIDHFVKHLIEE
jgi:hypothetical protein